MNSRSLIPGLALLLHAALPAAATEGYFEHGYGTQSKGMAGVGEAYAADGLAVATNPASAIAVGDRLDVDVDYFAPYRQASISGNAFGPNQTFSGNDSKDFVIPEFAYIRAFGADWAGGVAVYGNGGMDTAYARNPYARFGATGKAGVDLQQLFVSPTIAYQFLQGQSIGLSVNLVDELFKAQGIGAFSGFSDAPGAVSDRGRDSALGGGVRIGWRGRITSWLVLGASWQSKTYVGTLDKYKGLFAGNGSFDVPSTYGAGAVVTPIDGLDLAFDVRRIDYRDVPAVGDAFQLLLSGKPLGSDNGPGFGWKDTTTAKVGLNYKLAPDWQIRAGYAYTTEVVPRTQTFLNVLAPGVIQHELTAGTTWRVAPAHEISVYTLYTLPTTVHGGLSIPGGFPPAGFGGGEVNVRLQEISYGIGYSWHI